jgi:hypothetical protein
MGTFTDKVEVHTGEWHSWNCGRRRREGEPDKR